MKLQGVFPAMLTPFDEDYNINEPVLRDMIEFMIEGGVNGLFPVSNVGEQIQMSETVKRQMIDMTVNQAKGRVPVVPGISAAGTRQSVALGRYALAAGASAAVLSAPFYFPYPQQVIAEGLRAVAEQVDLPILLYNIPNYANPISLDTLKALMTIPNIVGMKDSSGSIAQFLEVIALRDQLRPDFSAMVGWEEMLFSSLELGGQGCMTACAGIFPEIMSDIYRSTLSGDTARGLALEQLIVAATAPMKQVFFPTGYKWAMEARGFKMGPSAIDCDMARYAPIKEAIVAKVEETLKAYRAM